jgi:hypothetical protein
VTAAVLRAVEPDEPTDRFARVEAISTRARAVPFGRTVLLWLAAVLYGLGYGVATIFGAVWFALVWVAVAVRLGWSEARTPAVDVTGNDARA